MASGVAAGLPGGDAGRDISVEALEEDLEVSVILIPHRERNSWSAAVLRLAPGTAFRSDKFQPIAWANAHS